MVNFTRKRHIAQRFPGTPSYITRQISRALPFTPSSHHRVCVRAEGLSMSGLFERGEFPHSALNFPKQAVRKKWLQKVPDKHAEQIFCVMLGC